MSMPETLPVYRVAPGDSSATRLIDLASRIFDLTGDFAIMEDAEYRWLRSDSLVVELHRASGHVWAANEAELWKPSLKPELLEESDAVQRVEAWLQERELLPKLELPFRWGRRTVGGTHFASLHDGQREDRQLDTQVSFPVRVGEQLVTGGGEDVTVTLGHAGKVIGFSGGWRPVLGSFESTRIEPEEALAIYLELMRELSPEKVEATLAYYAAPPFEDEAFLYPVYVYRGVTAIGERRMPLRQVLIPASEFGPPLPEEMPPQFMRPRVAQTTSSARRPRVAKARRSLATLTETNPFEAGASWIGRSGGLAWSQTNAQGFVDEWHASGWRINFNWGNADAFESDWHSNDDTGVDDVDFVFYTGHADAFGWILASPDDGELGAYEVGPSGELPGDLWGQNDLEWIIIAGCGPLQDESRAAGGGNALSRWGGAFDGLHLLMGYAATTQDNRHEGRKVAQYAKRGSSLIDAWFRTAKETQSSTNHDQAPNGPVVYAGAMWASKDGADPLSDHAWGFGSVSEHPVAPTCFSCLWTMC
jgi:hypothetical protein